jgi:hypothetical protein
VASTQPSSTEPTTQTALATTEPASQPAIKPFEQVKQEIIEKLAATQVEDQSKKIADDLAARLADDFRAIQSADPAAVLPTTGPTTAPAQASATTRPVETLMTLAHLEQIRSDIQQKYHVAIALHDIVNDWQTTKELGNLPGIGSSSTADHEPFAGYATSFARPTTTPIQVWQPSLPLTDAQQNTYVFRLTAAQPAHAPPDLAPLAKQVEQDWKLAQAYELAKQAAQKAYDTAKTSGLSQAARASSQGIISTPLFPPQRSREVPSYPGLDPLASRELLSAAADLILKATPTEKHPDALVELPSAQRIVVMELAGVQLPGDQWLAQIITAKKEQQQRVGRLAGDWFNYDTVVSRTGYKPEEKPS